MNVLNDLLSQADIRTNRTRSCAICLRKLESDVSSLERRVSILGSCCSFSHILNLLIGKYSHLPVVKTLIRLDDENIMELFEVGILRKFDKAHQLRKCIKFSGSDNRTVSKHVIKRTTLQKELNRLLHRILNFGAGDESFPNRRINLYDSLIEPLLLFRVRRADNIINALNDRKKNAPITVEL